jgi:perosamine synthetase
MVRKDYLAFGKPNFSTREIAAVSRVLRSGWIGMGPETITFEKELARFVGAPQVVTVNSCTAGLFLSLLAHGIGPGDEVLCPSLTWCSTANAALYLGATPVFCDVDPDTLSVTPELLKSKLTRRTRAAVVVHMGGLALDMRAIRRALPHRVAIVEDAAHAFGAAYPNGRPVGSSGNLVCYSFYANKNLSTAEGGAIALADGRVAGRLRALRLHALPIDAWKRYSNPKSLMFSSMLTELGYKMNFTDLQASIGRVQLRRQKAFAARRLAIARHYWKALSAGAPDARLQTGVVSKGHSRHLFTVILPTQRMRLTRNEFIFELRKRNIGASVHYAALHEMPLYRGRRRAPSLPATEEIARAIVTLPISASMTVTDAKYVIRHFLEVYRAALR